MKTRWNTPFDLREPTVRMLCGMVNKAYDEAELGLWKIPDTRTTIEEIQTALREGRMMLAELKGQIVGCIQVTKHGFTAMEFGMLAVSSTMRGAGIGQTLRSAVERHAKTQGCKTMLLEFLTPKHWKHPDKERLAHWYRLGGYSPQASQPFEKAHPEKAQYLTTECDFTVWTRSL